MTRDREEARARDVRDRGQTGTAADPGDVLFSPVQQRVLGLLFGQPDRRFRGIELVRLAASTRSTAHRLLSRLANAGLIVVESDGRETLYRANRMSPVFAELHGLVIKTSGLIAPLRRALEPLADRIDAAFVYGSVARGVGQAASDVDLIVIAANVDYAEIFSALKPVVAMLGRTINPNVVSLQEWRRKRKQHGVVARIAAQPRLFVIGGEDEIR